jgi:hypothetical protein
VRQLAVGVAQAYVEAMKSATSGNSETNQAGA